MATRDSNPSDGPILPGSTRELVRRVPAHRHHPGLRLDKLSASGDMKTQHSALLAVAECRGDEELLKALLRRREGALDQLRAHRFEMKTLGPLTLHLSRSGALENAGTALHPVYGFVHLPGSGLKGMARAWAETVWAKAQADPEEAWRRIGQAFGWSDGSETRKRGWRPDSVATPDGTSIGRIVFHDAWPLTWPQVQPDIANIHHQPYYTGKDDPGDWHDPVPVYFLAVKEGTGFEFALSDRKPDDDGLLALAEEWLREALELEGAGAKTAAGYGRFTHDGTRARPAARPLGASHGLCLASPAFLAGARQDASDCDLRPATLRGLLRSWWRTMHAAHVDLGTLRRLETAVWGDANSGSPVRISLEPTVRPPPEPHPDRKDQQFRRRHDLQQPEERKVTQGLFYASYGMAEKEPRWLMPVGAAWKLHLSVRDGRVGAVSGGEKPIPASMLLEQAEAALWLLARFGGAGSRSRKGFGSFDDIEVRGIASRDDCIAAAARFRDACGVKNASSRSLDSAALEDAIVLEKATPWRDPWFALDRTGMALQLFAKGLPGKDRMALGLPRRTGSGPDARDLSAGDVDRHASPANWSLARGEDDRLTVRLIAFPAPRLPDLETSKRVLGELVEAARARLDDDIRKLPNAGLRRPDGGAQANASASASEAGRRARTLEKGKVVEAVLLDERTRKGGWRAKHEPTEKKMPIQNSAEVPDDCKPGDRVELYVFSSDAFQWLSEKVKQQLERRRSAGPQRAGAGPRGHRSRQGRRR